VFVRLSSAHHIFRAKRGQRPRFGGRCGAASLASKHRCFKLATSGKGAGLGQKKKALNFNKLAEISGKQICNLTSFTLGTPGFLLKKHKLWNLFDELQLVAESCGIHPCHLVPIVAGCGIWCQSWQVVASHPDVAEI
jgi:hypothetical protein